jgi:hypothetical protein
LSDQASLAVGTFLALIQSFALETNEFESAFGTVFATAGQMSLAAHSHLSLATRLTILAFAVGLV